MRILIITIGLVCLIILGFNSYADEIVFENGERLIGTFKRSDANKLIFKSEIAGKVSVDISKIKNIYSEKLLEILLDDDTILRGKIIKRQEDTFTVQEETAAQKQTFVKANLRDIYPAPRPKVKVSGNLSAGFKSSHGGSFSEDTSVSWDLLLRSKKHRFKHGGWIVNERSEDSKGDKQTTDENYTFFATYAYFFTEKIFGFWSERYKKDRFDNLNYRITSAWGGGYQWSETEKLNAYTFAGLGYLQEKYEKTVPNPNYTGFSLRGEKEFLKAVRRRNDIILQSGYHLAWQPFSKIHYISNFAFNPAIDDWGNYNLTHDSEIRAFINTDIYATFKFIIDYDSTPLKGSASTETDYILGLGWKF